MVLLLAVAFLASRFVLPPVFKMIARLPELVLVGALAWCFALAGFADWLGLSTAMGALIAGVMISTFPYTLDVVAKVTSLRDFFVTLFFVGLGMEIPVADVGLRAVDDFSLPVPHRQPVCAQFSRCFTRCDRAIASACCRRSTSAR